VTRWALFWVPLVPLMIGNGVARQFVYGPAMGELAAHQLSTVTGAVIVGTYTWLVFRRLRIERARQAWLVGFTWLALTVTFEFGFGHCVAGHSWARLLQDYDVTTGRVWSLFLLWLAVTPRLVLRLRDGRT